MKQSKLFLCILLIAMALGSSRAIAFPRSKAAMHRIAEQVLTAKLPQLRADKQQALQLKEVYQQDEFSIIEAQDHGFVIVRSDDSQAPVLAYSSQPYDASRLPDGFKWWLATMQQSLKSNKGMAATATAYTPVDNLIATQWGQGDPYNSLCPTSDGSPMPTGCVATAMAQIVNYFQYPAQGKGQGAYTLGTSTAPIRKPIQGVYYYDLMLPRYKSASATDEQKEAVAVLMRDLGLASNMAYEKDGSGAMSNYAAQGLVNNMGYDSLALHSYFREWFDTEEWMAMVASELRAGRPVFYGGSDASSGGHAFVISGIDENGLVYVNWGWDGTADGYYDIKALNPTDKGKPLGYSYKNSQNMIFGFRCAEEPLPDSKYVHHLVSNNENFTAASTIKNFINFTCPSVYNQSFLTFYGTIGFLMQSLDDESVQYYIDAYNTAKNGKLPAYEGMSKVSKMFSVSSLPAGKYRIMCVAKALQQDTYQPIRQLGGLKYIDVTKAQNGTLTFEPIQHITDGIGDVYLAADNDGRAASESPVTYVYDIQGHLLHAVPTASFNLWDIPQRGILIVKQGDKVRKIIR